METKVQKLIEQLTGIEAALGDPDVFSDQSNYKSLTQKHAYLSDLKNLWEKLVDLRQALADNQGMLKEGGAAEFLEILNEDIQSIEARLPVLELRIEELLVPPDPNDNRPIIMELRAGTGGDEAALFVGDCVRMYKFYADKQGWAYEELSFTGSESGGYKEYVMSLSGKNVHRMLKYEGGTHRVQRVPETEAQGRVHTSAITIAVLLEPDEEENFDIDEKELRIETYRASGAGGQHVNTTDSAVRVTHVPSGLVAYCSQERSQHKNKDKAMRLLKAKMVQIEREKKEAAIADNRAQQVGSGDRSGRIRTYNFPQNRLTDHRIGLTVYSLEQAMDGSLDNVIPPLVAYFYQKKLQAFDEDPS